MAQAEAKTDNRGDLFAVRSILFLPASNPRAIAKARDAGSDLVVLDLEDAVRPDDKLSARNAAVDAAAEAWPMPIASFKLPATARLPRSASARSVRS